MSGIDCSVIVSQPFSVACIFAYSMTIILPIMLALCLMLSGTYHAQNYASIIGWCLLITRNTFVNFIINNVNIEHRQVLTANNHITFAIKIIYDDKLWGSEYQTNMVEIRDSLISCQLYTYGVSPNIY